MGSNLEHVSRDIGQSTGLFYLHVIEREQCLFVTAQKFFLGTL